MRQWLIFLLALSFPALLFPQTGSELVYLKPHVEVLPESTRIFFQDFIENPHVLDEIVWVEMGKLIFGFAPLSGRSYQVEANYVVSKIQHHFPELSVVPTGLSTITIAKPSLTAALIDFSKPQSLLIAPSVIETLSQTNIQGSLEEMVLGHIIPLVFDQDELVALALRNTHLTFEKPLPEEIEWDDLQINVSRSGRGVFVVFVRGLKGNQVVFQYNSRAQAVWYQEIAVSKTNISYGQSITNDHVEFRLLNYYEGTDPIRKEDFRQGFIARSFIRSGVVLSTNMFIPPWDVRKGQTIMAQVEIDGVVVRAQVEVLKDGRIGELIRTQNTTSGAYVTGILEEGLLLRVTF